MDTGLSRGPTGLFKRFLKTIVGLGRRELVVVVSCLMVILDIWGFLELADLVAEGHSRALEERIILLLRQPGEPSTPIGPSWMVELARDFTALGSGGVVALVILAVVGFLALDRRYGMMWLILIAAAGGAGLSMALKSFYDRPRPDLVPALAKTFTASFPSGHSMLSAVVYLTLGTLLAFGLKRRRLKFYVLAVAVLVTTLVGLTRIYLGVHYPTDVLAGWTAGFAWAALCLVIAQLLQRRGAVEETQ